MYRHQCFPSILPYLEYAGRFTCQDYPAIHLLNALLFRVTHLKYGYYRGKYNPALSIFYCTQSLKNASCCVFCDIVPKSSQQRMRRRS